MLLALLLMAGLFAFVSCGEEKNYTVEGVNERGKTMLALKTEEVERIDAEVQTNGWALTQLKGFETDELSPGGSMSWISPSEEELLSTYNVAAKVRLIQPMEVWRIDKLENGRHIPTYISVYTVKIEKLFYTDGQEKEGDTIRFFGRDVTGVTQPIESSAKPFHVGHISNYPMYPFNKDIYMLFCRELSMPQSAIKAFEAEETNVDLFIDNVCAIELENSLYAVHRDFDSLSQDAELAQENPYYRTIVKMQLEADDMDKHIQALVDRYKK